MSVFKGAEQCVVFEDGGLMEKCCGGSICLESQMIAPQV